MVHCNNRECEYNQRGEVCSRNTVYYIDRLCMSFSRMPGIRQLMGAPFRARCRKTRGKYKSDRNKTLR